MGRPEARLAWNVALDHWPGTLVRGNSISAGTGQADLAGQDAQVASTGTLALRPAS